MGTCIAVHNDTFCMEVCAWSCLCPRSGYLRLKKISAKLAFVLLLCYIRYQYLTLQHPFAFKASGYLILKEEQA